MKHATSRLLFSYWDTLRGERSAPDRADIKPGQIRQILADTFILGARSGGSAVFRLAGTRFAALFGQDMKDVPFDALWPADKSREAAILLEAVLAETSGVVAGLVGTNAAGARIGLELVLLPLKHNASLHTRALGAISPVTVPSWIGLVPVTRVEAQSLRIVTAKGRTEPMEDTPPPAADRRGRFTVLEGGLAG